MTCCIPYCVCIMIGQNIWFYLLIFFLWTGHYLFGGRGEGGKEGGRVRQVLPLQKGGAIGFCNTERAGTQGCEQMLDT